MNFGKSLVLGRWLKPMTTDEFKEKANAVPVFVSIGGIHLLLNKYDVQALADRIAQPDYDLTDILGVLECDGAMVIGDGMVNRKIVKGGSQ